MSQSGEPEHPTADDPSLEQLADDLAGVERTLEQLEDGSYWIDPLSGEPRSDEVVTDDPTAHRAPPPSDPAP
jgi:hypothetical protein